MMMKTATILLTLAMTATTFAMGPDTLVRFDGGIGVIPAQNGAGPANADGTLPNVKLNVVRGVNPGGGPWTIGSLRAEVTTSGRIRVDGRGLLLASGNSIGTPGGLSVFATLICEAATPFTQHNTGSAVVVRPNGDFQIDDTISDPPQSCASPVLLIRVNATGGPWLAAGIQKLEKFEGK